MNRFVPFLTDSELLWAIALVTSIWAGLEYRRLRRRLTAVLSRLEELFARRSS